MHTNSLAGLNWLNFLVAVLQTGFGAFLAVFLTGEGWDNGQIGLALGIGAIVATACQVPGGMVVDAAPLKRPVAALAVLAIAGAAALTALLPREAPVIMALAIQAAASTVLTPAIAAITLALSHRERLGERLGNNVRFSAMGAAGAAAVMGVVGAAFSHRAILFLAAASGVAALGALRAIRADDVLAAPERTDHRAAVPRHRRTVPDAPLRDVLADRCLLTFAACTALFQFGNAALLPIAAHAVTLNDGRNADLIVAASIVVPQVLAVALSPWFGRRAQTHGRRPVLALGFAVLPLRALLFGLDGHLGLLLLYQSLDGISAAVLGVMVPLVAADVTHRTGRFNFAIGVIGFAGSLGAAASTVVAGRLADLFGDQAAFLALAAVGLLALATLHRFMPETCAS